MIGRRKQNPIYEYFVISSELFTFMSCQSNLLKVFQTSHNSDGFEYAPVA